MKKKYELKHSSLLSARERGDVESFISVHESDPSGDLDKLDAVIKRPVQENGSKARPASSQDASDD